MAPINNLPALVVNIYDAINYDLDIPLEALDPRIAAEVEKRKHYVIKTEYWYISAKSVHQRDPGQSAEDNVQDILMVPYPIDLNNDEHWKMCEKLGTPIKKGVTIRCRLRGISSANNPRSSRSKTYPRAPKASASSPRDLVSTISSGVKVANKVLNYQSGSEVNLDVSYNEDISSPEELSQSPESDRLLSSHQQAKSEPSLLNHKEMKEVNEVEGKRRRALTSEQDRNSSYNRGITRGSKSTEFHSSVTLNKCNEKVPSILDPFTLNHRNRAATKVTAHIEMIRLFENTNLHVKVNLGDIDIHERLLVDLIHPITGEDIATMLIKEYPHLFS